MRLPLSDLRALCLDPLIRAGLLPEHAAIVSEVFYRATLRGVGHHDIHDLPFRLGRIERGERNLRPAWRVLHGFGAVEIADGDNGLGEWCAWTAVERAEALARDHGIGLCAVRNSNHFLCAHPYVAAAAERGSIAIIMSKSEPDMHAPAGRAKVIGNSPLGFAAPSNRPGAPALDISFASASYGKLRQMAAQGKEVPSHWGQDAEGQPCADPAKIVAEGCPSPAAGHKGYGLSLMIEALTGPLSSGGLIDQLPPDPTVKGLYTQTAIVLRPELILGNGHTYADRLSAALDRIQELDTDATIPGERSEAFRSKCEAHDAIELNDELIAFLRNWRPGTGGPQR